MSIPIGTKIVGLEKNIDILRDATEENQRLFWLCSIEEVHILMTQAEQIENSCASLIANCTTHKLATSDDNNLDQVDGISCDVKAIKHDLHKFSLSLQQFADSVGTVSDVTKI